VTDVLDHGSVTLVDFMGGDSRVDQAAGVSLGRFDRQREEDKQRKIIKYMMKHRHGTPFEHSVFTFHVKTPIYVAREWMRHRIGSYNEISARYTEIESQHYNPKPLRGQSGENRQGSVELESSDEHDAIRAAIRRNQDGAFALYHQLLDSGIAREIARGVLPQSTYTEFVWTVNARSLMNFISLRMTLDAQYEIRVYAEALYDIFMETMPLTAEAFTMEGYKAP